MYACVYIYTYIYIYIYWSHELFSWYIDEKEIKGQQEIYVIFHLVSLLKKKKNFIEIQIYLIFSRVDYTT